MKTFTFKNLNITLGFIPFLVIGFMPKKDNQDNNSLIISFLFIAIELIIPRKEQLKRNLIKAKVSDYRLIKIKKDNGYDEYYEFDIENGIESLPFVYKQTKLGTWTKVHTFVHTKLGYICKYTDEFGKWNKTTRFNIDEICPLLPDSEVKGYFKRGRFIVVS